MTEPRIDAANDDGQRRRAEMRRYTPALAGAVVFVVMALLYAGINTPLYTRILTLWGERPYAWPFLDTDTVLSALRCVRRGVDVLAVNPCDSRGRVFDYSPLWLTAAVLPVTTAWIVPVGLALDAMFLASLMLLPPARGVRETIVMVAAVVSTATAYAVERGNNDLVIFVLAAAAAALACRGPRWRVAGYGLAFLAGLLKYYPMVLMGLALRERPRRFWLVAGASAAGLLIFAVIEGHALVRALHLIPHGSYFSDMFGASTLPGGLAQLQHLHHHGQRDVQWVLVLGALGIGLWLGAGAHMHADLAALSEPERVFLFAGALLVLGFYLTAQNIGYRAVELLLVVPGISALWRQGSQRFTYGISTVLLLVLLWAEGWRHWLDVVLGERAGPEPTSAQVAAWAVREAAWWWIVAILFALVTGLVLRSDGLGWVAARKRFFLKKEAKTFAS
jgi:hypothetical protein